MAPPTLGRFDELMIYSVVQQSGDSLHRQFDFGTVVPGFCVLGQAAQEFGPAHNYRQLVIDPVNDFFFQHGFLVNNARNYLPCTFSTWVKKFKQRLFFCSENGTKGPRWSSFAILPSAELCIGRSDKKPEKPYASQTVFGHK
jgi:hypothetical protein